MVKSRKQSDLIQWLLVVLAILIINYIISFFSFRLDLTQEKRYSLNQTTKDLVENIDDIIYFKVYLDGDLKSGLQKLQRETMSMLDELRALNTNIQYEFIDPRVEGDSKATQEVYQQLHAKGLVSFQVEEQSEGGKRVHQIFPGAIVHYGDKELPLQLLLNQFASSPETQINISIQNLEFTLASIIKKLTLDEKPTVAFLKGHGELDDKYVADIGRELNQYYNVDKFNLREFKKDSVTGEVSIQNQLIRLNTVDALIVAKPTEAFNDLDKFLLDQYVMKGGKVLWLLDAVWADMDSLSNSQNFLSYPIMDKLNLTDLLFKYGARINPNLVQDIVAGGVHNGREINRWIYFPLLMPQTKHPIVKDLNAVKVEFASTVDTIIAQGIKKTFLLRTSPYTKVVSTPHSVDLKALYEEPNERSFTKRHLPIAVLLEGEFASLFANRLTPQIGGEDIPLIKKGRKTQMLVVGDGDIIKNQLNLVNPNIPRGTPLQLGYDQFTGTQYGNKDFLMNALDYMLDENGLISLRSRELKIRLLDQNKIKESKRYWQLVNVLLPIVLIILFGVFYIWRRKRKYAFKK